MGRTGDRTPSREAHRIQICGDSKPVCRRASITSVCNTMREAASTGVLHLDKRRRPLNKGSSYLTADPIVS